MIKPKTTPKPGPIVAHNEIGTDFLGQEGKELSEVLSKYIDIGNPNHTLVLSTSDPTNILSAIRVSQRNMQSIINLKRINDVRWINRFYQTVNHQLPIGGYFVGCVETPAQRKERIMAKFPFVLNHIYFTGDYIFKRVFPKLPVFKDFYFFVTSGRNRVISQAETFGRLYYCGFEVVDYQTVGRSLYYIARKKKTVMHLPIRNYGPIFKMKRMGMGGEEIDVYKIRSMCAYSEYLQEYVFEQNNLADGGKIKDDFRITTIGKYLRRSFLDELPMLYNVLRGDLKLVGVRPISKHYLSLYDDELRDLRIKVKPGLVPPFYADMPKSLEDIILSEKRYIKAYLKNPLKTDLSYFFRAFINIGFRRARSN